MYLKFKKSLADPPPAALNQFNDYFQMWLEAQRFGQTPEKILLKRFCVSADWRNRSWRWLQISKSQWEHGCRHRYLLGSCECQRSRGKCRWGGRGFPQKALSTVRQRTWGTGTHAGRPQGHPTDDSGSEKQTYRVIYGSVWTWSYTSPWTFQCSEIKMWEIRNRSCRDYNDNQNALQKHKYYQVFSVISRGNNFGHLK